MDNMKQVILMRHGETAHNKERIFQSDTVSLSQTGRQQIKDYASTLRKDVELIIHSPSTRALESAEIIAQSIKKLADGVRAMDTSGLSERAIIILLRDASGLGKREIENVLWALRSLERLYLKTKS